MRGLLHPGLYRTFMNGNSRTIVDAVTDYRPAIVIAGNNEIEFIAALWAMLGFPQVTGFRMKGQTLWAAVTVTPDCRFYTALSDKGIVTRNAAVIIESYHGTVMVAGILRRMTFQITFGGCLPVSDAQKQITVFVKSHTATVVTAPHRIGGKDFLDICQAVIIESATNNCRS